MTSVPITMENLCVQSLSMQEEYSHRFSHAIDQSRIEPGQILEDLFCLDKRRKTSL